VFPESRPWDKDQEKADLETEEDEGDCEKTIHEMGGAGTQEEQEAQDFCASCASCVPAFSVIPLPLSLL
jgi:hypothetical protein